MWRSFLFSVDFAGGLLHDLSGCGRPKEFELKLAALLTHLPFPTMVFNNAQHTVKMDCSRSA